jgi:hypothetical protein
MRTIYILTVIALIVLLTGGAQAAPVSQAETPHGDSENWYTDLVTALLDEYSGDVRNSGFLLDRESMAAPVALPAIDYNCDGYIAFADAAVMISRLGSNVAIDLWAFDLDHDGSITTYDIGIVAAEVGRDDLPAPVWCAAN